MSRPEGDPAIATADRSALVVVDMQHGFVGTPDDPGVEGADAVVDEVNAWVAHAVAHHWPRFYTQDVAPFDDADDRTVALADVVVVDGEVVAKGPGRLGGFSGFVLTAVEQPGGLPGDGGLGDLATRLRDHDVAHLVVVGLAADVCVAATARDARRLGYRVTVPTSATAPVHAHPDGDEAAWQSLRDAGVVVTDIAPADLSPTEDRAVGHGAASVPAADEDRVASVEELVATSRPRFSRPGAWHVDQLDLEAYLDHVGHHGPVEPTRAMLEQVYAGHRERVPFTNVTGLLDHGHVPLDLDTVQDRLVRRRRGGWCLEHVVLFAAVLERLGLPAWRVTGRVQPDADRPRPRTHAAVVTRVAGTDLLCDVGFGAGVLAPLPLVEGVHDQGPWSFRLDRRGHQWRLSTRTPDGWAGLHVLTMEHVEPSDLELTNHYVATAPRSPFTGQLVAMRTDEHVRLRLLGTDRVVEYPDGRQERTSLGPERTLDALRDHLDVHLDSDERRRLEPRLTPSGAT